MFLALRPFRLARGPEKPGLRCDADGVTLGGVQLLRKSDAGFEPRSALEIDVLTKAAYGATYDTGKLTRGLTVAAQALNDGDLGRAMIATLHLRLPGLSPGGPARLSAVDAVLAKYSPDQPRDWHGRWTSEGAGSGGPGETAEARPPAPHRAAQHRSGEATGPSRTSAGRPSKPSDGAGQPSAASAAHQTESDNHLISQPTGGRLIQADWDGDVDGDGETGFGDNSGERPVPAGRNGPEPDPDPALPTPKVRPGWDQPYRVVNGVELPAGRYPKLADGRPWPTAEPEPVRLLLLDVDRNGAPVEIFVPRDGIGPMLLGSTRTEDFERPPGYDTVYLRGTPQRTMSRGVETAHARSSVEDALRLARSNDFSDIYFNTSLSVISNGRIPTWIRPDVTAVYRPVFDGEAAYAIREILSPRQSGAEREQQLRPLVPGMRDFDSRAYKLLLKLLRALGLS